MLSMPTSSWVLDLKAQYHEDEELISVLAKWQNNELDTAKFSFRDGLLFYKNKLLIEQSPELQAQILLSVHNDPMASHCLSRNVMFVRECDVYQGM